MYDYLVPITILSVSAVLSLILAFWITRDDKADAPLHTIPRQPSDPSSLRDSPRR